MPRLSLPHKPNLKQLASEQQELSTGEDEDEGQFDYWEDEDPIEENQTDVKPTLEDCSKGDEDLKLKDEQCDDLTTANCSSMAPSGFKTPMKIIASPEFPHSYDFIHLLNNCSNITIIST